MDGPAGCPAPVAIEAAIKGRHPQNGLHRPRVSVIIPNLTAAGTHPDCRPVLMQIVALQLARSPLCSASSSPRRGARRNGRLTHLAVRMVSARPGSRCPAIQSTCRGGCSSGGLPTRLTRQRFSSELAPCPQAAELGALFAVVNYVWRARQNQLVTNLWLGAVGDAERDRQRRLVPGKGRLSRWSRRQLSPP